MRITIVSIFFPPQIGGVENIMLGLAQEWNRMGHNVQVFTLTPGDENYGLNVVRDFSVWQLTRAVKKSDVFFEANISLRTWWIGLLNRKKWYVIHHLTFTHVQRWQEVAKHFLSQFPFNISVSQYVNSRLRKPGVVINNFYDPKFRRINSIKRERDIVFVGRLVSDKGAEDLVMALYQLRKQFPSLRCSIIGKGPEYDALIKLISRTRQESFIELKGLMLGEDLVTEINRHKVMVIPSRWPEPYGIVALEGLACGCRIVCTSDGGLPEAAGEFGMYYPNGNVDQLANLIPLALEREWSDEDHKKLEHNLQKRRLGVVAGEYIKVFKERIQN